MARAPLRHRPLGHGQAPASGGGGYYCFDKDNREWPDTFSGSVEFGPCPAADKGFVLQNTGRAGNQHERYPASNGKAFYGTDATLVVTRGGYTLVPKIRGSKKVQPEKVMSKPDTDGPHQQAFLHNVRDRTTPSTDAEVGHHASILGHLMNIAWGVGRRIHWDSDTEQVVDDTQATALVTKEYRAPTRIQRKT